MPPSSTRTVTITSSNHPHILMVNDDLDVICFKRNGQARLDGSPPAPGPFFVVREWDAKVIRAVKKKSALMRPGGVTTEQALRASVRQSILNMNLNLEPANKAEIQYLKSVNVLGKRAPSCSLLNVHDLLKLLYCFDKKRHAEDLKHALKDEERFTPDDPSVLITRVNTRVAPRPIVLKAAPKTPIPPSAFSIRAVEVTLPKLIATSLVKKASRHGSGTSGSGGGSIAKRKRRPAQTEVARAAAAAAAAAAGLGVEGLDALLSALRKPIDQDGVEEEGTHHTFKRETTDEYADENEQDQPDAKRAKLSSESSSVSPPSMASSESLAPPSNGAELHLALRVAAAHHAASESPRTHLPSPHHANGTMPPIPGVPSVASAAGLLGPSPYYSPALGFKRGTSTPGLSGLSSPTNMATSAYTRPIMPTALAIPPSPNGGGLPSSSSSVGVAVGTSVLGSPIMSGPFYRNLLSPGPAPSPTQELSIGMPAQSPPAALSTPNPDMIWRYDN